MSESENQEAMIEDYSDDEQIIDDYVENIKEDNFENYKASALTLIKEEQLDEAVLLLRALIIKGSEIYNSELNINLGEVYFEIGNTLLKQIEESDDQLFGNNQDEDQGINEDMLEEFITEDGHLDKEKFQQMLLDSFKNNLNGQINGEVQEEGDSQEQQSQQNEDQSQNDQQNESQDDENQDKNSNDQNNQNEEKEEDLEDVQVAWENIETSRVIFSKFLTEQKNLSMDQSLFYTRKLAHCYLRLGDIELHKEDFSQALQEYISCEQILQQIEDLERSRRLAEVYFLKGNCYLYENKEQALENALVEYQKGKKIIELLIKEKSLLEDKDEDELTELKQLRKIFLEKVEDLQDEIEMIKNGQQTEIKNPKELVQNQTKFPQSEFNEQTKKLGTFGKKREPEISNNIIEKKINQFHL